MRHLIETRYAVEAMKHPQELQDRLQEALREIDAMPLLSHSCRGLSRRGGRAGRSTRRWPEHGVSHLEPDGPRARAADERPRDLRSRRGARQPLRAEFSRVHERRTDARAPRSCRWDVFGEALPFGGAQERNTLHARAERLRERPPVGDAGGARRLRLPDAALHPSQSAYFDAFGTGAGDRLEGPPAGEVEFTVYGWGLTAIYTSGPVAWPLDEATFARVYRSRRAVLDRAAEGGHRLQRLLRQRSPVHLRAGLRAFRASSITSCVLPS